MKLLNLWQNAGESDLKTQYMGHVILLLYSLNFFTDVHFSNIACCYTLLLLLEKNINNVFWFNITTVWNNLFSFLSAIYSSFQNKQITYCTVFQNKWQLIILPGNYWYFITMKYKISVTFFVMVAEYKYVLLSLGIIFNILST